MQNLVKLSLTPQQFNMTLLFYAFLTSKTGLTVETCENVSHNTHLCTVQLEPDVDMAAARRTLPSDYTAQAKAFRSRAATKLYQH